MDQGEYSTPSRAERLWGHLSGLFGGEALKRKYGLTPPPEWEAMLSHLSLAQLEHGVQRLLKSGSEHIPSLPQFLGMCRDAREYEPTEYPQLQSQQFDKWAVAANNHFMAVVLRRMNLKRPMTEAETRIYVQFKNSWAEDMRADDKGEGIPVADQKAAWDDCMSRARAAAA